MIALRACILLTVLAAEAAAGSTVDGFEGGVNSAGWTFNAVPDVIEPSGGNPGAWLHNPTVDSFAPILTSTFGVPSAFVGNYRAMQVSGFSIDARTDAVDFSAAGRELTLLLRDTNGTPSDFDDDDFAYFVGALVPQPGQGWVHYDYAVPSTSTAALPPGWTGGYSGDPEHFRPGIDWNDVITSVDRVEVWWIDPALFAIFQQWDVGVDNVTVTTEGPEPYCFGTAADCPCGNGGLGDRGCDNAQATGGAKLEITAYAPDFAGGGTAVLRGSGFPPAASPTVIVIRSLSAPASPSAFGDGLLCLGTPVVRFGAAAASGGFSAHPVSHGAGSGTFRYQLWYRNNPAAYCDPMAAFNTTNGLAVPWP